MLEKQQLNYEQVFEETINEDYLKDNINRMIFELARKYGTGSLIDSESIAEVIVSHNDFLPGTFRVTMSIRPEILDLSSEAKKLITMICRLDSNFKNERINQLFSLSYAVFQDHEDMLIKKAQEVEND